MANTRVCIYSAIWASLMLRTVVAPDCNPPCQNNAPCMNGNCDCTGTGYVGMQCEDLIMSGGGDGGGGGGSNNGGGSSTGGDGTGSSNTGTLSTAASITIAVVVALVVLVAAVAIITFYCKRHGRGNKGASARSRSAKDNTKVSGAHFKNQPRGRGRQATVYDKAERKIGSEFPREKLKLHEHLGSGAFANVVRADAMDIVKRGAKTVVAVKMLKEMATDSDRNDFMKEFKVYKMLEPHPNVIAMLGCCTQKEPRYLIMEYAPHGNLQSHLRGIRNAPESPYNNVNNPDKNFLTPSEVLTFASQVANGMKYLASKQCIHRDLATRNVLLGDGLACKLSDFGLARDISEQNLYEMQSRGRVPVRWMAPESLLENTYTSKSDVWSFGVLMWELVTVGSHPYPGMSSKRVIDELQKGFRLPKPEHCSNDIYSMMLECWQDRPDERPTFVQIHQKIESMLENAQGYLAMIDIKADNYIYLEPDQISGSSIGNDDDDGEADHVER